MGYLKVPADTRQISPVTTGTQKDEEADEEESDESRQAAPQDNLHLSAAEHVPRGSHGGSRKWHKLEGRSVLQRW